MKLITKTSTIIETLAAVLGSKRTAEHLLDAARGAGGGSSIRLGVNRLGVVLISRSREDARSAHLSLETTKRSRTFGPVRYMKIGGRPHYFFTVA